MNAQLVNALKTLKKVACQLEFSTAYWQQLRLGVGTIPFNRKPLASCNWKTQIFLDFFLHGQEIQKETLQEIISQEIFDQLLKAKFLIMNENEKSVTSTIHLLPINTRYLLLVPRRKKISSESVYLGADSLTFARYLHFKESARTVLDLGTGTGFLLFSLPWQDEKRSYLGIDVNEHALKIARLNAAFNETPWMKFVKLDVRENLTSHLKKHFDLIIGNLPIIPTPQETNCKWFRRLHSDGGADGQTFLKSALTQAPSLLERNGEAIFLACSLGTPNRPFLLKQLTEMASRIGMSIKVTVIKKIPVELDAFFRAHGNIRQYNIWMQFFEKQGAAAWYRLIIRVTKSEQEESNLQFLEMTRTDFFRPLNQKNLDKRLVILSIPYYLTDIGFHHQNTRINRLVEMAHEIMIFIDRRWKEFSHQSVMMSSHVLQERFPEIFPTLGSAILFWGNCVVNLAERPPQLTRKLL